MAGKRSPANTAKKQEYVAKLVKENPGITLNEVGKRVAKDLGTQLAYDKLREAFTSSGGKVDTRRGPGRGSKRGPGRPRKTGAKRGPGRPRKYGTRSPQATQAKQDFVAELVRSNSDITMNEAGKRVRGRFGTQLAFDKLKQAFTSAGGKVGKPGRRAKPRDKVVDRKIGRRASDRAAARIQSVLKDMPKHIVVMHVGGSIDTSEFATREQAVAFTRTQLQSGVPVSSVGYYLRQPLEISLDV